MNAHWSFRLTGTPCKGPFSLPVSENSLSRSFASFRARSKRTACSFVSLKAVGTRIQSQTYSLSNNSSHCGLAQRAQCTLLRHLKQSIPPFRYAEQSASLDWSRTASQVDESHARTCRVQIPLVFNRIGTSFGYSCVALSAFAFNNALE